MSRFHFSSHAEQDIDGFMQYLRGLPLLHAQRIGAAIQEAIATISSHPKRAPIDEPLTQLCNSEIRRMVSGDYVILYTPGQTIPVILAVIHGKRDIESIMRQRLG